MQENTVKNYPDNVYNDKARDAEQYDVVLLQLPLWGPYHPPLAHGLLKSYLQHNGISCKTIDINAHVYTTRGKKYFDFWHVKYSQTDKLFIREPMVEMYKDFRTLMLYYMNEIKRANPIVVGCSVFDSSRILTEVFLDDLRRHLPGIKHVLGGPGVAHFMKNTDSLLDLDHIDAVCQDEGENAIVDYVKAVKSNSGEPVAGMVYKKDGKIITGPPSAYKGKLDTLPYPDFEGANLQHYIRRTLPLYSSRGCVNKCNYCSAIGFMTNKRYPFRFRSGKRMFDEVVYFKKIYPQVEEIRMANNIDNGKMSALDEFCDLMIESGLNEELTWTMESSVVRKEMRKPVYEKMRKAGCTFLTYGVETPAEHLLEKVGKTLALQKGVDLPAILREGKEAGIDLTINIMIGLPGETEEDFQHLCRFLEENKNALIMVNPAIQFCEYYPGSSGNANPEKIGIDMSKGTLMWETKDGTNTYLVRMDRFERFANLLKKLKIDNFFQIEEIFDKHQRLFEYYYVSKDAKNAAIEYNQIPKEDLTEETTAKFLEITTGDRTALDKYIEKQKNLQVAKLEDYVTFRGSIDDDFVNESLSNFINDYVKIKPYDREYPIHEWKHKIRKVLLVVSGYNKIEFLINEILLSLNKIDKAVVTAYNLKTNNNNKFKLIKESFDELSSHIEKTNKGIDNVFSSFYKKINKTHYYYLKINKMMNLFVEGVEVINSSEQGSDNRKLNSILKELYNLANSIDENENRVFSKLMWETHFFAFYNRVVGYRNTERGIIMLHTVIDFLLKKMIVIKDKKAKVNIPKSKKTNDFFKSSEESNPVYATKI